MPYGGRLSWGYDRLRQPYRAALRSVAFYIFHGTEYGTGGVCNGAVLGAVLVRHGIRHGSKIVAVPLPF